MPPSWLDVDEDSIHLYEHPSLFTLAPLAFWLLATEVAVTFAVTQSWLKDVVLLGEPLPVWTIPLAVLSLAIFLGAEVNRRATAYVVTDNEAIEKHQFFGHDERTLDLSEIDTTNVSQSFIEEEFLNIGTVELMTAGDDSIEMEWRNIPNPKEAKAAVAKQGDKSAKRRATARL